MNIFHTQHSYTNWRFQEIKSYFEKRFRGWGSNLSVSFARCQVFYPGQVFKNSRRAKNHENESTIHFYFPSVKSSKKQILKMAELFVDPPRSLRGNSKPKSTFSFSVTSVHSWFPMKWWNGEKDRGNGCVSQDLLERRSGIGGNRVRNRGESRAKITRRRNPLAPWLTEQLLFAWEELAFGSSHCSVTK